MKRRKVGKLTAPNCPQCGRYMDFIEAWVCRKCGKLKERKLKAKKSPCVA